MDPLGYPVINRLDTIAKLAKASIESRHNDVIAWAKSLEEFTAGDAIAEKVLDGANAGVNKALAP